MQEADLVHLPQALEQRPQDGVELGRRQRPFGLDALVQRLAAQQLHDDVGGAVLLEEVEDLHDGRRLVQGGERAALLDEAFAAPAEILGDLGRARQHRGAVLAHGQRHRQIFLERHLAIELGVAGAIGDAEAALAEHAQDLVAADAAARRKRHVVDPGRRSLIGASTGEGSAAVMGKNACKGQRPAVPLRSLEADGGASMKATDLDRPTSAIADLLGREPGGPKRDDTLRRSLLTSGQHGGIHGQVRHRTIDSQGRGPAPADGRRPLHRRHQAQRPGGARLCPAFTACPCRHPQDRHDGRQEGAGRAAGLHRRGREEGRFRRRSLPGAARKPRRQPTRRDPAADAGPGPRPPCRRSGGAGGGRDAGAGQGRRRADRGRLRGASARRRHLRGRPARRTAGARPHQEQHRLRLADGRSGARPRRPSPRPIGWSSCSSSTSGWS